MNDTNLIVMDGLRGTRKELMHIRSWLRDIGAGGLAHLIGPRTRVVYWGNDLSVIVAPKVDQRLVNDLADRGYIGEENHTFRPSMEEGDPGEHVTVVPLHLTATGRDLLRLLGDL